MPPRRVDRRSAPLPVEQRRCAQIIGCWAVALSLLCAAVWVEPGQAEPQLASLRFSVPGLAGVHGPREHVIAVWSKPAAVDDKLPIVIAFHGKTESELGPSRGYASWVERYGLGKAYAALLDPPLSPAAFGGLVRPDALSALNQELHAHAFQGVVTVGVYTPDLLLAVSEPEKIQRYAEWVAHALVPEVQRKLPLASTAPRQVGVDGVSLGGMVALEVGLRFPAVFGANGAMQPAVRGREALLAALAEQARTKQHQNLRLLSSDRDPLLPVTRTLSTELRKRHVAHQLVVTPGGHDYAFNRGPGAIELLHFHDRALREVAQ